MEPGSTPELCTFDAYESEVKEVIGSCATIHAFADELLKQHFITRQRKADILQHPNLLQHEKLQQFLDAVRSQVKHNPGNFDVFIGIMEELHPLIPLADKMKRDRAKPQVLLAQQWSHGSSASASTPAATAPSPTELKQGRARTDGNLQGEQQQIDSHDITGQIEFRLRYTAKQLLIHVLRAEGLSTAKKSYVKTYLLPDPKKETKRKTSIQKRTTSPVYNESLKYESVEQSELKKCTLWLSVWDSERFGRNRFLGEVCLPFSTIDLTNQDPQWYELQDEPRLGHKFSSGKHARKKSKKSIPDPELPRPDLSMPAEERKRKSSTEDGSANLQKPKLQVCAGTYSTEGTSLSAANEQDVSVMPSSNLPSHHTSFSQVPEPGPAEGLQHHTGTSSAVMATLPVRSLSSDTGEPEYLHPSTPPSNVTGPVLEKQTILASELEAKYCPGSCTTTTTATAAKGHGDQGLKETDHAYPSHPPRQATASTSLPTSEPAVENSASQDEVVEPDDNLEEYLRMLPPGTKFKVILIGDSNVGKSSLIVAFRGGEGRASTTVGVDVQMVETEVNTTKVALQIFDTAGTEKYKSMMVQQYRNALGVIFVFDITDPNSLESIVSTSRAHDTWMKVLDSCHPHAVKLLVGNKCDLEGLREVDTRTAKHYAEENGMLFLEASAKNNHNVREIFQTVASEICRVQREGQGILQQDREEFVIVAQAAPRKRGCKC